MEIGHGARGEAFTPRWNRSKSADGVKVWTPQIPHFSGSMIRLAKIHMCLRNERGLQCTKDCVILDKACKMYEDSKFW